MLDAVLSHLKKQCPADCALEVVAMTDGAPASTLAPDHPLVLAAQTVLKQVTGSDAVHVRLGASVPVTSIFKETLGIDTLMFGYNLPDEDVHAPNEFFRVKSIEEGARGWTLLAPVQLDISAQIRLVQQRSHIAPITLENGRDT